MMCSFPCSAFLSDLQLKSAAGKKGLSGREGGKSICLRKRVEEKGRKIKNVLCFWFSFFF